MSRATIVMIMNGEGWRVVCMIDRVRLLYLTVIIKEGLRRERRVAIWYRLVYRLRRAGLIIWNRGEIGKDEWRRRRGKVLIRWIMIRMIKLPMVRIHTWLPLLHAESTLIRSIFLAGIALKIGGVVIIRGIDGMKRWKGWEIGYMGLRIRIITLVMMRVGDNKVWVAYSSVVHMVRRLIGLGWWEKGGLYLYRTGNILHTWSSPLIFCICYIRYKKRSSRRKERMVETVRGGVRWGVVIRVIIRVNIRLPMIRNVVGERTLVRRRMEIRWEVRGSILVWFVMWMGCNLRFMMGSRRQENKEGKLIRRRRKEMIYGIIGIGRMVVVGIRRI